MCKIELCDDVSVPEQKEKRNEEWEQYKESHFRTSLTRIHKHIKSHPQQKQKKNLKKKKQVKSI